MYRSKEFDELVAKLPSDIQYMVDVFEEKLAHEPFLGKPLGFSFLREKRLPSRRAYFLVYQNLSLVLMVTISSKKSQRDTIAHIKKHLREYDFLAKNLLT